MMLFKETPQKLLLCILLPESESKEMVFKMQFGGGGRGVKRIKHVKLEVMWITLSE